MKNRGNGLLHHQFRLISLVFFVLISENGCTKHNFSTGQSIQKPPVPPVPPGPPQDNLSLTISGLTSPYTVTSGSDSTSLIQPGTDPTFSVNLANTQGAPTSVQSQTLTLTALAGSPSGSGTCTYLSATSTVGTYACSGFTFSNTSETNLPASVKACLTIGGHSTCSNVFLFNVATGLIPPGPLVTYQVSLAVRNLACAYCHAQVIGNIVSDFGYNYSAYYTQASNPSGFQQDSGPYSPYFPIGDDLPPFAHSLPSSIIASHQKSLDMPSVSAQFYGDMLYNYQSLELFPYSLGLSLINGQFYLPKNVPMASPYFTGVSGANGMFAKHMLAVQSLMSTPNYVNPLSCTTPTLLSSTLANHSDVACTAPVNCSTSSPYKISVQKQCGAINLTPPSAPYYGVTDSNQAALKVSLYSNNLYDSIGKTNFNLNPSTLAQYVSTLLNLRTSDFITMLLGYVTPSGGKLPGSVSHYAYVPVNEMSDVLINPPVTPAGLKTVLSANNQNLLKSSASSFLNGPLPTGVTDPNQAVYSYTGLLNTPTSACNSEYYVDGNVYLFNLQLAPGSQCIIYATGVITYFVDPAALSSITNNTPFASLSLAKGGSLQLMSSSGIIFGYPGSTVSSNNALSTPFKDLNDVMTLTQGSGGPGRAGFQFDTVKSQFQAILNVNPSLPTNSALQVNLNSVLCVAPIVISQFTGTYNGSIVANFLLPYIGNFYFQFNGSLVANQVFPSYPLSNYFRLTQ